MIFSGSSMVFLGILSHDLASCVWVACGGQRNTHSLNSIFGTHPLPKIATVLWRKVIHKNLSVIFVKIFFNTKLLILFHFWFVNQIISAWFELQTAASSLHRHCGFETYWVWTKDGLYILNREQCSLNTSSTSYFSSANTNLNLTHLYLANVVLGLM